MNIFHGIHGLPAFRNAVVTTGSFDGVHRGHQRLLARIRRLAREYDGETVVITFDPHPRQVLFPSDDTLRLLTSTTEKLQRFEDHGVDNVVVVPFTFEFSQQSPREYVEKFLIGAFRPRCIVAGYNHRFGLNRQGNLALLEEYGRKHAFDVVRIDRQEVDHINVSSTKIRDALAAHDMTTANALLNYPYRISGKVISGYKVGSALGYPTANIAPEHPLKLIPPAGVYAAIAHWDGLAFDAMLYIGTRPTLRYASVHTSIEVHLIGFSQEIYGDRMTVELIEFVREDLILEDTTQLQEQITRDKAVVIPALQRHKQMMRQPSVAMVALNYNGLEMLRNYMPPLTRVRLPKLDTIIADNASTDDSLTFLRNEYPDVHVIAMNRNAGYAGGYNQALSSLDYDYYALINTDVDPDPDWLEPIVALMEREPDIAACQPKILSDRDRSRFEYAGAAGGYMDLLGYSYCAGRILSTVEKDTGQYDTVRNIFWASGAALVIRARAFHAAGGFDDSYFAHQEEIDLCWTLQRAGFRIVGQPASVVFHLGGATLAYDTPQKVYLNFRNNLTTIVKHLPPLAVPAVLFVRFFLDLLAAIHFLLRWKPLNALAVLRAYLSFWLRLPATLGRRMFLAKLIRTMRTGPSRVRLYHGSILFDYYILGRRTFSKQTVKTGVEAQRSGDPL